MNASARLPAIQRRPSPRDTLLVFEISGKITKADIEGMASQVDAAFEALETVDLLLLMTDFEGLEAGAVFDGPSFEVQARSIRHVRKYGVVGAPAFARAMIEAFGHVSPVNARTFELGEQAQAWAWIEDVSQ
jgi:hypothetical protein